MNVNLWKERGVFMAQQLFEQNLIIYAFIGMCGLGLILRLILNVVYRKLLKESDKFGSTNHKRLKHTKLKFETCYKLKIGVNNVDTFVDKSVLGYRLCGILLSTWENYSGQTLFISLLAIPLSAVFGAFFKCEVDLILFTAVVGMSTCAILVIVDKIMNIPTKKKIMKLNMLDYLENFYKVRLEREIFHPELLEEYRKEYFQVVGSDNATNILNSDDQPKDELNRRREARRKKEEEKRLQALRREEEHRRIVELRKEEETKKLEEKRILAAKRREEERLKLEVEQEAANLRRAEAKKKTAEKMGANDRILHMEEKDKILHNLEEELTSKNEPDDMDLLLKGIEEIAAERDQREKERQEKLNNNKFKARKMTQEEEKLIEDVLKEFFA